MKASLIFLLSVLSFSLHANDGKEVPKQFFQMSFDLLYWQADEGRLQFATRSRPLDTTTNFAAVSRVSPSFDWNTGVRGMFGYFPSELKWDCFARVTHIQNKAYGKKNTNTILEEIDSNSLALFPVLSMQDNLSTGDSIYNASMNWKALLNELDLCAGYTFNPWKWLTVRPQVGFRAAQINQKLKAYYSGGLFVTGTDKIHMTNRYWGVGPLITLDPEVQIWKGVSVALSGAGSVLLGQFHLKGNEYYFSSELWNKQDQFFRLGWVVDFNSALKYKFSFCEERYKATFSGGWEYHLFFNQNQFPENAFDALTGTRNLSFMGWFLSGCLNF